MTTSTTTTKITVALLIVASCAAPSAARSEFRQRIPNALNVAGVDAIGHVDTSGGGARNAFGKDFQAAGLKWTTALCQKDSDGDGQTNGQELGDPCCTWVQTSNEKVLWTSGVSSPGDAASKSNATQWASTTLCGAAASSNSSTTTAPPPAASASNPANAITVVAALVVAATSLASALFV